MTFFHLFGVPSHYLGSRSLRLGIRRMSHHSSTITLVPQTASRLDYFATILISAAGRSLVGSEISVNSIRVKVLWFGNCVSAFDLAQPALINITNSAFHNGSTIRTTTDYMGRGEEFGKRS